MLFQAYDDEHTSPGCVFDAESETGSASDQPPGPEDVKHFDILEFVKEQEGGGSGDNDHSVTGESDDEPIRTS